MRVMRRRDEGDEGHVCGGCSARRLTRGSGTLGIGYGNKGPEHRGLAPDTAPDSRESDLDTRYRPPGLRPGWGSGVSRIRPGARPCTQLQCPRDQTRAPRTSSLELCPGHSSGVPRIRSGHSAPVPWSSALDRAPVSQGSGPELGPGHSSGVPGIRSGHPAPVP